MEAQDQSVIIDLHGSKATRGVELDGFQRWLEHFRRALRDFERSRSPRREQVKRTGRPGPVSDLATAFRLVEFRIGSGIATLEPVDMPDADQLDMAHPEAPAIRNLRSLMESVEAGSVNRAVVEALEDARKSVGDDGSFGIKLDKRKNGKTTIDSETIERLGSASKETPPALTEMTVSGLLHLIEVEEPECVAIRDRSGIDWLCTFEPELEAKVLRLVKSIVWATGTGGLTTPRSGKMHLREIREVPRYEQSSLFTFERVPLEELEAEQGIAEPQGLAAVQDPEWADDEQDRAYLALVLGEDSES
jgi:hypothetical protein